MNLNLRTEESVYVKKWIYMKIKENEYVFVLALAC